MTAFDRSYPLWEFTLVERLEGDRAALVMKLHHSLTDGIGAMQLALLLFDAERTPTETTPGADAPADERFGTGDLIRASLVARLGTGRRVRTVRNAVTPRGAACRLSSDRERPGRRRDRAVDRTDGGAGARHPVADHEDTGPRSASRCSS